MPIPFSSYTRARKSVWEEIQEKEKNSLAKKPLEDSKNKKNNATKLWGIIMAILKKPSNLFHFSPYCKRKKEKRIASAKDRKEENKDKRRV